MCRGLLEDLENEGTVNDSNYETAFTALTNACDYIVSYLETLVNQMHTHTKAHQTLLKDILTAAQHTKAQTLKHKNDRQVDEVIAN